MTVRLAIRFPLGRYQAAAWGTHPNEGTVEWPPSPWRILRGLYATWQERGQDLDPAMVRRILSTLVEPPRYWLPPAGRGHSRHYYPDGGHGTDLTVDAFCTIDRTLPLVVEWDATLDERERDVLAVLAARMPYLGRADSLCEAELTDEVPDRLVRVAPAGEGLPTGAPTIRLLAVDTADDATLTQRPAVLRRAGYAKPLGTRWVTYLLPEPPPARLAVAPPRAAVTALRWSVASRPRPSVLGAVAVGHVLRRAVMRTVAGTGSVPPVVSGKNPDGSRLTGHDHAHFLCLDTDRDGLIDVLALWVPAGLPAQIADDLSAALRRLRGHEHIPDFRPCALGFEALGSAQQVLPELVGPAQGWRTATPFAPRYAETSRARRGRDRWPAIVERQVRRELAARGAPEPSSVAVVRGRFHALEYRRHRPDRERLAQARRAAHVEVQFPSPVTGPIAVGALSHFGLGLLEPIG